MPTSCASIKRNICRVLVVDAKLARARSAASNYLITDHKNCVFKRQQVVRLQKETYAEC